MKRSVSSGGQDGSGGVVGGAQQDHPGARGHRRGHGVQVVPPVAGQRDPDALGPGQPNADRVGLEGAPGVDDLVGLAVVVLPGEGGQQLVQGAPRLPAPVTMSSAGTSRNPASAPRSLLLSGSG